MLPLLSAALALLPALSTTPLSGDEPIAIEAGSSVLSGKSSRPSTRVGSPDAASSFTRRA